MSAKEGNAGLRHRRLVLLRRTREAVPAGFKGNLASTYDKPRGDRHSFGRRKKSPCDTPRASTGDLYFRGR